MSAAMLVAMTTRRSALSIGGRLATNGPTAGKSADELNTAISAWTISI